MLDPAPPRGTARRRSSAARLSALAAATPGSAAWQAARLDLHGALAGTQLELAEDLAAALDERLTAEVRSRPGIGLAELVRAGAAELRRQVGPIGSGPANQPGPAGASSRTGSRGSWPRTGSPATAIACGRPERRRAARSGPGSCDGPTGGRPGDRRPALARRGGRRQRLPAGGDPAARAGRRIVRIDDDLAWALRPLAGLRSVPWRSRPARR